jgi:hypothetical protein
VIAEVIKAITPGLALVIILAVMPKLITMLAQKVERQPTKSAVDFSLGTKYFCFQFFVVFLFNTIIGAASSGKAKGDDLPIVSLFNELKDDPGQITGWLADAIPQQACSSSSFVVKFPVRCVTYPADCLYLCFVVPFWQHLM